MVAFDLRGHGGSEMPAGDAFYNDYSLWADDVHSVIDELALIKYCSSWMVLWGHRYH